MRTLNKRACVVARAAVESAYQPATEAMYPTSTLRSLVHTAIFASAGAAASAAAADHRSVRKSRQRTAAMHASGAAITAARKAVTAATWLSSPDDRLGEPSTLTRLWTC